MRTVRSCLLLLALCCPGTLSVAQEKPRAPEVDFRIVPETKDVEPGECLELHVFISNKSAFPLQGISLDLPKQGKITVSRLEQSPLAGTLPPFGHTSGPIRLCASEDASFGTRELPFRLRFQWKDVAAGAESALQATVPVNVEPPFSAEAKGLPGGTGALFALLLPVIPAFLVFQILDRWRTAQVFQMPTFSSDYVLPAFFIAILAKALATLLGFQGSLRGTWGILALSAGLGAVWPLSHHFWDRRHWRRWGFQENDEPESYLRKVLLSPQGPRHFTRVLGNSGAESWAGILLRQPNGSLVLGSELQITHPPHPTPPPDTQAIEEAEKLVKRVNEDGSKESREQLLREIERGSLRVGVAAYPKRGDQAVPRIVVSGDEIEGFVKTRSERKDILSYSQ